MRQTDGQTIALIQNAPYGGGILTLMLLVGTVDYPMNCWLHVLLLQRAKTSFKAGKYGPAKSLYRRVSNSFTAEIILCQLTARHCLQLVLDAGRAAVNRYLLPARPTAANCCMLLQRSIDRTDSWTDRQTLDTDNRLTKWSMIVL